MFVICIMFVISIWYVGVNRHFRLTFCKRDSPRRGSFLGFLSLRVEFRKFDSEYAKNAGGDHTQTLRVMFGYPCAPWEFPWRRLNLKVS